MEGFNQCVNGHYYKNNLSECPYCPKNSNASGGLYDKTQVNYEGSVSSNSYDSTQLNSSDNSSGGLFDKTQVNSGGDYSGGFDKTQLSGSFDQGKTQSFGMGGMGNSNRDMSKTFIQEEDENQEGTATAQIRQSRKITGWIVSFTLDPMGMDFRIYEGINSIGRDGENTITIQNDMSVSGKHISILSKKGKFYLKDEMAVNGTFINNIELEVGKTYDLMDGDEIKLGTTVFKFRSSL
jgi:hypothetical protein